MNQNDSPDVIVVGAGVVGLSIALALRMRGHQVTVIERSGPAAGASAGNAGTFAFTDILPLASPGIMRKAPGWLMDPLGPLSVRPSYAFKLAPWLYRFWRACAPAAVEASTAAQTAMMDLSRAELEPFLTATGTHGMLAKLGSMQLYEGEAEFEAALAGWDARARHGIKFDHLDAAGVAAIQPGIAPRFTHGTFTPAWYSISDPKLYTQELACALVEFGGRLDIAEVVSVGGDDESAQVTLASGEIRKAGHVVISAGAWSHQLAVHVGDRIPLETERGYNTTLPSDAFDLRTHLIFGGHGFMISRLGTGIRVGGAVELGGLKLPPNFKRSEAMLKKARSFLPELKTQGGVQWMGHRPSLPDTLPAIGASRASRRVIHAFGHGHLGLTQSPGTARIVADLVEARRPPINLSPFLPQRF